MVSSHSYQQKHAILNLPNVMVFMTAASPNYYMRIKVDGYYTNRSLKTSHLDKAITQARILAPPIIRRLEAGLSVTRITIADIFSWYLLSEYSLEIGTVRRDYLTRVGKLFSGYFGEASVENFQRENFRDYWSYRLKAYSKKQHKPSYLIHDDKPSIITLNCERSAYHQVLRAAKGHGKISQYIMMPKIPAKSLGYHHNPTRIRPTFTEYQYRLFREHTKKWVEKLDKATNATTSRRHTAYACRAIFQVMRHSGGRLKEYTALRHGDLEKRRIKTKDGKIHTPYALFLVATKHRHHYSRYALLTHSGTALLKEYLKYKQEKGLPSEPGDYVFMRDPEQVAPIPHATILRTFREIARSAGVYDIGDKTNPAKASTKTLRRLYIQRSLDNGADITFVAHQVGNTPAVIQAYYNSISIERSGPSIYEASYYPATGED